MTNNSLQKTKKGLPILGATAGVAAEMTNKGALLFHFGENVPDAGVVDVPEKIDEEKIVPSAQP